MNPSMKLLLLTLFALLCLHITNASNNDERQIYIVYMGEVPESVLSLKDDHHSLLSKTVGDETTARKSMIYSYGKSINGFAARLLPHEAESISKEKGVVSVFPNKVMKLKTTRSWDFLGLPRKDDTRNRRGAQVEGDTIVGIFDTGVWEKSPSFDDNGFGPPPKKWKGKCDKGGNFTGCNNKIIGARFFNLDGMVYDDETTPVDTDGHGTHTASTAAGIPVANASLYGIASGVARGAAQWARIASYKVCWGVGCQDVDLLAAFDAAIADGVDVISVSIGGNVRNFTQDSIGIGSFHAMRKGILTVCAAGNDGPDEGLVQNVGPWLMTVAASTTDRKLVTAVKLGNEENIYGVALNTFVPNQKLYPLINGALARNNDTTRNFSACDTGSLDENKIKGKIVYCQGMGGDNYISSAGGAGTIMSDNYFTDSSYPTFSPATYVGYDEGIRIDKYINSTRLPQAVILKTTSINVTDVFVAVFSSRGPQQLSPNILKPDISAPGVDILAAFTTFRSITGADTDNRMVKFMVETGTSMATPHVTGAAAYVKSRHPTWSPAAIKSALMTTATVFRKNPVEAELASGSGQLNPSKALRPGLVYDIDTISYVSLLCRLGYTNKEITLITGANSYNCSSVPRAKGADGLNYPSIYLQVKDRELGFSEVYYRTVTNVGDKNSVYKVNVTSPKGLNIKVVPDVLTFKEAYQKVPFTVTVTGKLPQGSNYLSGSVVWSDSKHSVRSPVLVSYYNMSEF